MQLSNNLVPEIVGDSVTDGLKGFVSEMLTLSQTIADMTETVVAKQMSTEVEQFQERYTNSNKEKLKSCNYTWYRLHMLRQQMMLSKEDYCNNMFEL